MKYIKNENIIARHINPSYFLIDMQKCYNNEHEQMFITDEMGFAIWNCVDNNDTKEMILDKILSLITDDKTDELIAIITSDLENYLESLVSQNIIMEAK